MKKNISLRNCDLTLLNNNNPETILSSLIKKLNLKPMLIFIGILFFSIDGNAQTPKIRFEYDAAGNQIQRKWCPNCNSKNGSEIYKEISKLEDSDLQKFFPEDVISYYPNPVKEELYLKWELVNENKVSSIDVFTLNGQVLKTVKDNISQNSLAISFQEYPVGIYFLSLNYTNGDKKSIKIVKN
jgi:hypothetical protein